MRRIYLTIAPRRDGLPGAIERASYVQQDDREEGTGARDSDARVAWRILGVANGDPGVSDHDTIGGYVKCGQWMRSCRTWNSLSDGFAVAHVLGSDEAMIAWLDGGAL